MTKSGSQKFDTTLQKNIFYVILNKEQWLRFFYMKTGTDLSYTVYEKSVVCQWKSGHQMLVKLKIASKIFLIKTVTLTSF